MKFFAPFIFLCLWWSSQVFAQKAIVKGWHLLDDKSDGYYGISLPQAYEFLKGKKSTTVIVAVIDSGVDTTHEDLKPIIWRNTKEQAGNGVDDDKNGFIDDWREGGRTGQVDLSDHFIVPGMTQVHFTDR